ncbi:rhodanese-like domain-containing protein [Desulfonema magnum]|uniref:Rhodanese-like and rubrerythrin domains-containing protein n=1 Tax=Desulfonema magnum TaxID=45655 RepID=A0A975GSI6_9BACT|nr:rhodanese-like domain-containing protein [Desulfonema magnum]QTA91123.1 Rhodanese-like and rubrerythrin domains-containing protein [Desulfonema magnum]
MRWKQFSTPVKDTEPKAVEAYIEEHGEESFTLLDVRQPKEYEMFRIPGAKLIPLPELPDRVDELPSEKPVIVYCAMGGRSNAAAQFLAGKGFKDVQNLRGGAEAWQGHSAEGPANMGMFLLKGNETPAEIIQIAYGLEEGLKEFYTVLSAKPENAPVANLLTQLSKIEEKHKQRLFNLYLTFDPGPADKDAFERTIMSEVMEGGLTTEEFLEQNKPVMQTAADVLNIAMMLEAQAMDLYMRYAEKSKDENVRKILFGLADEEKAHLKSLGNLLDKL